MLKLSPVLVDRRLWLLIALSASTLALGRFVLPAPLALDWVRLSGYWFMLALVLCTGVALVRLWREHPDRDKRFWRSGLLWAAIGLATMGWHAHENFAFKILSDEAVLAGTSQNLHLVREVGYPVRTTNVRGPFEVLQTQLDKRPVLFPFLVSIVHDWTGYRPTNGFWLNSVLGVCLLVLAAGLARRLGGEVIAAPVAVAWLAGIPLLAQQVNGGGFELLNLTLLVGWVWLAMIYASNPTARVQDAFVLVAVMLGSARYESLLYLAPTALLMLWVWWRRAEIIFSPLSWLAPVLLLPTFWLNQAFKQNADFWEMQSLGATHPFGLDYLAGNLGHALNYLLSVDGYQPNSPVFGLLGLLALPFLLIWAVRRVQSLSTLSGDDAGLLAGILGLSAGTGLMMLYFWGQFDHPVIHRLSLPTQLLLLIALLVLGKQIADKWRPTWRVLGVSAAVVMVVWTLPVMSRNAYSREYTPGLAFAWRETFLDGLNTRNILVIDRDSLFWTIREIAATPVQQAQARKEGIAFHFRNKSFDEIYAFQTLKVDPNTGTLTVVPEDDLGAGYTLEPVVQHRLAIGLIARISRVTDVRYGEDEEKDAPLIKAGTKESAKVNAENEEGSPAMVRELAVGDAAPVGVSLTPMSKSDYIKTWVENLP